MTVKGRAVQKTATLEIVLEDGTSVHGKVFVPVQTRLTDVLNDDRQFLPVECADGAVVALAKSAIKQVKMSGAEAAAYTGSDPYQILGVSEGVSDDELKRAYHQLCFVNHPDRIKGLGLSAEYLELAHLNMARINSAYAQVSRRARN